MFRDNQRPSLARLAEINAHRRRSVALRDVGLIDAQQHSSAMAYALP